MLLCVVLALTLLPLFTTVGGSAAPPTRNGQLLYMRPLGGNAPPHGRLFLTSPSGEGARDITPAGIHDVQGAAWSPDGRRIAISAIAEGDNDPEIFVVAADGTRLRRVTDNQLL
jgi:Tol biopolymer transport system component